MDLFFPVKNLVYCTLATHWESPSSLSLRASTSSTQETSILSPFTWAKPNRRCQLQWTGIGVLGKCVFFRFERQQDTREWDPKLNILGVSPLGSRPGQKMWQRLKKHPRKYSRLEWLDHAALCINARRCLDSSVNLIFNRCDWRHPYQAYQTSDYPGWIWFYHLWRCFKVHPAHEIGMFNSIHS